MRRRRAVLLAVCVAVVPVIAFGSGGFTSVGADRGVTVDTVGDEDAYLGLEYEERYELDSGDSVTYLTVTNQFSVVVAVSVSVTGDDATVNGTADPSHLDPGGAVSFDASPTCEGHGEETREVEFNVEAVGDGVTAETDPARTTEFRVECSPATATASSASMAADSANTSTPGDDRTDTPTAETTARTTETNTSVETANEPTESIDSTSSTAESGTSTTE